jgi:hypothetical protein
LTMFLNSASSRTVSALVFPPLKFNLAQGKYYK